MSPKQVPMVGWWNAKPRGRGAESDVAIPGVEKDATAAVAHGAMAHGASEPFWGHTEVEIPLRKIIHKFSHNIDSLQHKCKLFYYYLDFSDSIINPISITTKDFDLLL